MSNPQGVCLAGTCLILAEPFKVVGTSVTLVSCGKQFRSSDGAQEPFPLVWFGYVSAICICFPFLHHISGAYIRSSQF